jgi:hypothetical protein
VEENIEAADEAVSTLPEGFVLFEAEDEKVSFAYPEAWGVATLKQGEEERMGHLTAGSQKVITFSLNDTVVAGIASTDWTHDPDMGHGGVGEPGVKTMADAKLVKADINAKNILIDTDDQFAFVTYCADNCSDTPKLQLQYTMAIESNSDYSVIQFYQFGDDLGTEFFTDDLVDYEKLDDADLSLLFPATDPLFTTLQKIAATVSI